MRIRPNSPDGKLLVFQGSRFSPLETELEAKAERQHAKAALSHLKQDKVRKRTLTLEMGRYMLRLYERMARVSKTTNTTNAEFSKSVMDSSMVLVGLRWMAAKSIVQCE